MQGFNIVYSENVTVVPDYIVLSGVTYICFAVFLFLTFILGSCINGVVIYVFCTSRKVKNNADSYVIALCVCGFLISTLGVPFAAASCLSRKWLFGNLGCIFHAALVTALGITMISILTAISIDRYIFVVKYSSHGLAKQNVTCTILGCFIYGIAWSIFPIMGWSSYTLETGRISCSVFWDDERISSVSYCICLMIAGLLLPVSIIIYVYARIMRLLHGRRTSSLRLISRGSKQERSAMRRERRVARTVFLMIGAFIAAWLPYSIYATVSILGYRRQIPPIIQILPSVFAKASVLWNPIIYGAKSRALRHAMVETFPFLHSLRRGRSLSKTPVTQLSLIPRKKSDEGNGAQSIYMSTDEKEINNADKATML